MQFDDIDLISNQKTESLRTVKTEAEPRKQVKLQLCAASF